MVVRLLNVLSEKVLEEVFFSFGAVISYYLRNCLIMRFRNVYYHAVSLICSFVVGDSVGSFFGYVVEDKLAMKY